MTKKIPSYTLYGEPAQPVWHEALHVESISKRSGFYNWEIAPHRHDGLLQLLYLRSGSGEILLDNLRTPVRAPCILMIPSQIVHGFHWAGRVEGEVVTALQYPLESMAQLLSPSLLPLLQRPQVIPLPDWDQEDNPLLPLFRALGEEYHHRARDHIACSQALLLALLINVFRQTEADPRVPVVVNRRAHQIKQFRELVEVHFKSHRAVNQYAEELNLTGATLGRLCQEHLGMPPMAVINARLVLEAKRELAHSTMSIKEVAHELGFSDVGYFSRFFKKHTDLTPSDFRVSVGRQETE
ncbi:helix-turn-helix domain-containing protein [Zobellella iuensis]|uniref:Helix-turn-helix domain-containing protein n=1 Tax=Zobellella iuensis TaxID=2803811 RepID=A0ABS1QNW3_9GAMM|nr:helix-turn-helix domain-containing protein [Zobellella iuensis]MBL1375843.1 helix-turn-helix domain-containing protein [Zobellella iuensis]